MVCQLDRFVPLLLTIHNMYNIIAFMQNNRTDPVFEVSI